MLNETGAQNLARTYAVQYHSRFCRWHADPGGTEFPLSLRRAAAPLSASWSASSLGSSTGISCSSLRYWVKRGFPLVAAVDERPFVSSPRFWCGARVSDPDVYRKSAKYPHEALLRVGGIIARRQVIACRGVARAQRGVGLP